MQHQIDVSIEVDGSPRRVILECKDFDRSQEKVGLSIVRDFRSVIEDTGAAEGWIVTCNGFTADAAAYAKSKNIKLLVLRLFEEADWEGRVKKIVMGLHMIFPTDHQIDLAMSFTDRAALADAATRAGLTGGFHLSDPVFVTSAAGSEHFNSFVSDGMHRFMPPLDQCVEGERIAFCLPSFGAALVVGDEAPIAFSGVVGTFAVGVESMETEIVSQRVTEMLLQGFAGSDLIVFGDQLERFAVDPDAGLTLPR